MWMVGAAVGEWKSAWAGASTGGARRWEGTAGCVCFVCVSVCVYKRRGYSNEGEWHQPGAIGPFFERLFV